MLNIAWNIYINSGFSVCYFSLEMDPVSLTHRLIARNTAIDLTKLEHPEQLSAEEEKKVSDKLKEFEAYHAHKFLLLRPGERAKVSLLRYEIQKRFNFFKPRIVVVDYMYNIIPEKGRSGSRNDLEINDMLDEMRIMGANYGFHVITAAALTREAIKRLREQKPGHEELDTGDIMGGQVFGADSDNIYAFVKDSQCPANKLLLFCLKSREGKTLFGGNRVRAVLDVQPEIATINSIDDIVPGVGLFENMAKATEIAKIAAEKDDDDIGGIDVKVKRPKTAVNDFSFGG
jgi:hypothetical protein